MTGGAVILVLHPDDAGVLTLVLTIRSCFSHSVRVLPLPDTGIRFDAGNAAPAGSLFCTFVHSNCPARLSQCIFSHTLICSEISAEQVFDTQLHHALVYCVGQINDL